MFWDFRPVFAFNVFHFTKFGNRNVFLGFGLRRTFFWRIRHIWKLMSFGGFVLRVELELLQLFLSRTENRFTLFAISSKIRTEFNFECFDFVLFCFGLGFLSFRFDGSGAYSLVVRSWAWKLFRLSFEIFAQSLQYSISQSLEQKRFFLVLDWEELFSENQTHRFTLFAMSPKLQCSCSSVGSWWTNQHGCVG